LRLSPGGKLIVDAAAGSVEIKGSSRSGAHVLVTSRRDDLEDRYELKFEEGAATVTVTARRKGAQGGWFHWTTSDEAPHFVIDVIKTETSGGHIDIENAGGRVEAETSGGAVNVSFVRGNECGGRLRSSGGGIAVKIDKGANLDIDAETGGGHVSADLPVTVQ